MALNAKQRAFVREYAIDHNAAGAARRAGYSHKTADKIGYELLRKPEIAEQLTQYEEQHNQQAQLSRQKVIDGLLAEAEYQGEGSSHSARVAAWSHLGKYLGMFTDKVEQAGKLKIEVIRK